LGSRTDVKNAQPTEFWLRIGFGRGRMEDLLAVTIARPMWQAKRPVGPRPSEAAIPLPFLLACSTAAQGSEWVRPCIALLGGRPPSVRRCAVAVADDAPRHMSSVRRPRQLSTEPFGTWPRVWHKVVSETHPFTNRCDPPPPTNLWPSLPMVMGAKVRIHTIIALGGYKEVPSTKCHFIGSGKRIGVDDGSRATVATWRVVSQEKRTHVLF